MKIFHTLLILFIYSFLSAQINYVPNPSFEDYNNCPTGISGFTYSDDYYVELWYSGSGGTSDYMHGCATAASQVDVPENLFSEDQPAHTGEAYGGFWTDLYDDGTFTYREYVMVQLTETLIAGECYYVEFWSAPATQSDFFGESHATTDAIGAYLSEEKLPDGFTSDVLPYVPQVDNAGSGNYIDQPGDWTMICGFLEAEGGEEWITVGNFHPDDETEVVPYEGGPDGSLVYLFVDDVRVAPLDSIVSSFLHDTVVCSPVVLEALMCDNVTYLWNTGDTTPVITVYESGNYWVELITSCGSFADTAEVIFVLDSTYTTSSEYELCFTELPYVIEASEAYDFYSWNTGETSSTISIDEAGTYYVTGFTDCANFVDTFTVEVIEPLGLDLDLGNDTLVCAGEWTLQLNSISGFEDYNWSTG
ncbi:MAG: hypothetical protein H7X71_02670 [Chitinophagales bacterium]|nr:hypothetical protein [Chitinophagales bacterium]